MELKSLKEEISKTSYPGRGIVIGRSADGADAYAAYFIMGRSKNSRNRIFKEEDGMIITAPADPKLVEDPSLIIYTAVRVLGSKTIITNGDQTDTIYEGLDSQMTFEQSLRSRTFEPDAPNYTPRISGVMHIADGRYNFAMSIIKSDGADPDSCQHFTFAYENPKAGTGRFIHTYMGDAAPLPSFEGEPAAIRICGTLDDFTEEIWRALDPENKVALFTRSISIATGRCGSRIINKYKQS